MTEVRGLELDLLLHQLGDVIRALCADEHPAVSFALFLTQDHALHDGQRATDIVYLSNADHTDMLPVVGEWMRRHTS